MFAEGRLSLAPPVAQPVPWPERGGHLRPVGVRAGTRSVRRLGAALLRPASPLAMAAAMRIAGDAAIFAVVPLLGVLAVWSTWLLGRRLAGPRWELRPRCSSHAARSSSTSWCSP